MADLETARARGRANERAQVGTVLRAAEDYTVVMDDGPALRLVPGETLALVKGTPEDHPSGWWKVAHFSGFTSTWGELWAWEIVEDGDDRA